MGTRVSTGVDRGVALRDSGAQRQLSESGFAVLPLTDPDHLRHLERRIADLIPADSGPFFSLYRNDGPALRRRLDEVVRSELAPLVDPMLTGQRLFMGSALVKFPGEGSYLALHQDWSFVDESSHMNGLVWLGLDAISEHNGGLHAVAGSHRFDLPFRGTPPGAQASEPVDELLQQRYLTRIDTAAGDAVVYHNALIHGSATNTSGRPRIALIVGFVSEDADLFHFHIDETGQKWRFRVREDFFFDYAPPQRPEGDAVLEVEPWDSTHGLLAAADLEALQPVTAVEDAGGTGPEPAVAPRRGLRRWWRRR